MPIITASEAGGQNVCAFLDMVSFSEGTNIAGSDDGYDVMVGGTLFKGYATHPHLSVSIANLGINSTAAGRYQILGKYADYYIKSLKLSDFSPLSQDKIAIQLIKECGAYQLLIRGDFESALNLCKSRWASFPGSAYGQHENKYDSLAAFYIAAGGELHV